MEFNSQPSANIPDFESPAGEAQNMPSSTGGLPSSFSNTGLPKGLKSPFENAKLADPPKFQSVSDALYEHMVSNDVFTSVQTPNISSIAPEEWNGETRTFSSSGMTEPEPPQSQTTPEAPAGEGGDFVDRYTRKWKGRGINFVRPWEDQRTSFEAADKSKEATSKDGKMKPMDYVNAAQATKYLLDSKPMEPISLGFLMSEVRHRVQPNGGIVSSGINYGRDVDVVNRTQKFQNQQNMLDRQQQIALQQSSQTFTAQQNQLNRQNAINLQSNQFQFQGGQNALDRQMNEKLTKMNIVGNIASVATGGAFNLASTAIGKGADMYMQQQDFKQQKDMMTQNYNQQIQASGSRAQSLKMTA